jgi:CelD/BcsL family acetyltransferase involved in cellulose biosynthesis
MSFMEVRQVSSQSISVRVQRGGAELIEQLAADWRALCDESSDEIFYRPEWTQAYLAAFVPQAKLIVLSAWAGRRLCGVLPLLREHAWISGLPAARLTLPANVHCFRLGLAHRPGEEGEQALRALWQALKELPGWSVIDISHVVEGNGIDRLAALARDEGFPVARKRTSQALYLPITAASSHSADSPNSKDQPPWMAGTRPKFRSHLRRARRQLEEQGALALAHFSAADPAALERFYNLEASGWKGAEGTAIQCCPRTRRFYDAVAQAAARQGYLSLDFLELGGKPIAAHFGFNFRGRYFLAKAGYDESYRRYGPGQLLVNEVLNETPRRGLHEFDFVGPATWDESRWASARRTSYRIFIFRRNWPGKLLHALRISARDFARRQLGRQEDESAPLELKSKPEGSDKEKAGDKDTGADA